MFTIGIAGGTGSGKTTVVERLFCHVGTQFVSHLPHDAYYLNRTAMPNTVRETNNWDHPDALDNRLFVEHLDHLRAGLAIDRPEYHFPTHSRAKSTVAVSVKPVLLVEGILLFAIPEIRSRLDLKVYVDTPADMRILRRVVRDVNERGRSIDSVVDQYHATVRPMHERYVEPSRRHADVVIPWELHNETAIALLAARVREHLPDDEDLTAKAI